MLTEEEQKNKENLPESTDQPEKKRRTQPVVIYLIILTLVVIGMLILSYAMQSRNNRHLEDLNETFTGIQSSYDAMVTINDLQAQINTLDSQISKYKDQLQDYEDQTESLQAQLEQAKAEAEAASESAAANEQKLNDTIAALDSLLLLEQYYQSEDYETCAGIIESMKAAGYDAALSGYEWATSIPESKSAAALYAEISEAVQAHTGADGAE